VPEAAQQFGIGVPARGRAIDDLPRALPLLVVRAGGDQTPLLNASLDAFVSAAIARDLPLTLINQPGAPHSFDLFDDSDASRATIRRILAFLREQLER
jgi:acetyl esterase/lipase